MKQLCISMMVMIVGLILHYLFKDTTVQSVWEYSYFIWDKSKDLLLWSGYLWFIPYKYREVRFTLWSISAFCIIRIIWDVFAVQDYVAASDYRVIDLLLVILLYIVVLIWIYPIIKRWRIRKSYNGSSEKF